MNVTNFTKCALLVVLIVTFGGCNSKKDKSATPAASPQEKTATQEPSQDKGGAQAVPAKDKADAEAAAVRVLALLEAGDFSGIYKGASAGFQKIGTESQFVAKFQQTRQRVGVLKQPRQISAAMRPDKSVVLVYRVENDRYTTDMRLTFSRSANGMMELAGLNQHDELKKQSPP